LYAQLLIGLSFAIAAYQDIADRAVSDLVWVPAAIGTGLVVYSLYPALETELVKLALVGVVALVFTLRGAVGQADAIALVFVAADPYSLSPILPLAGAAIVALSHIGYEYVVGNARGGRTIPVETFLKEQRWIPKAIVIDGGREEMSGDVNVAREEVEQKQRPGAMVEVSYGVPTVAYLGLGYVGYLAYLLLLNPQVFLTLP
jgi:hypothetical protein